MRLDLAALDAGQEEPGFLTDFGWLGFVGFVAGETGLDVVGIGAELLGFNLIIISLLFPFSPMFP
ncbi:MAG: hypothetical protein K9L88_03390 [Chromatiaceae bacterium]|nr:hypothetical protein [Chromatiaceae bacterium]MCF8017723.1 hypothetical protein [Chromatiaceae bacterium]